MKILKDRRCVIGEGPIWCEAEGLLYYTNGGGNEICTYDPESGVLRARALSFSVAALAFDAAGHLLVSHADGVHILNGDGSLTPIYDTERYRITAANDMKVGPDGALYVGTQSGRRLGVSDLLDGRLYRISPDGEVGILLDGLILSNGMDWSLDEKRFYHTDSDTQTVREYGFDGGAISFTGREVRIDGVDGFTVGQDGRLYAASWGRGCLAVADTASMQVVEHIALPAKIPASCGFCGAEMDLLAVTTASWSADLTEDENAGFTLLRRMNVKGRKPYLFGG